jgi:hypothetical protein
VVVPSLFVWTAGQVELQILNRAVRLHLVRRIANTTNRIGQIRDDELVVSLWQKLYPAGFFEKVRTLIDERFTRPILWTGQLRCFDIET